MGVGCGFQSPEHYRAASMTADLFPGATPPLKPSRARPRVLMHVCDAGDCIAQYRCAKCSAVSKWLPFATITEAKRGIPCETCNKEKS